jgi:hypothetical protein
MTLEEVNHGHSWNKPFSGKRHGNTQETGELWYISTSDGSTWSIIAQATGAQLVTSPASVQISEQIQSVVDNTASVANDLGIPDVIFGGDDDEE